MFEQDGSASSTKRESLTSHITGTISDLTDSISQARSQRRKASLPPASLQKSMRLLNFIFMRKAHRCIILYLSVS
ncbi:Uncharacterised protein [Rothia dentocariosa]|uniref:Uncharacterized protein n=1 Tax=Rothia dentocariosa TaxID=2047 RepID=A0A3S4YGQ6_9MICC|nr:Uncharacterised protein [Rothia dentocariosa]